jgi:hypothetical protein
VAISLQQPRGSRPLLFKYYRARQKSATTLNEEWIPRVGHKLLWPDARVCGAQLRITHRALARVELLVHENQKTPMK